MDPQLLIPSPAAEFNFDSTSTSPYATAPTSPKMFSPSSLYLAPTSPIFPINPDAADDFQSRDPFTSSDQIYEQKNEYSNEVGMDFAFDFSGQLEGPLISAADELFDSGRIKLKPLEPRPPPLQLPNKKKYSEPFSEALHQTPRDQSQIPSPRGRQRTIPTTRHKVSRSLSPLRVSDDLSDDQKVSTNQSSSSSPFGFIWYNKWNLKNLLLFRSTSEGSATTSNDPLKKYAMITKGDRDIKNSSFRSCDGGCSIGGSSRMMKRKMSAHEIHYTANRAAAVEMRRKTFLPYKSGLLGCLGFRRNLHEISSRGR